MNVLVNFSLYGTNPLYSVGAVRNAELYARLRPEWGLRFYTGLAIASDTREDILKANPRAEIIEVGEPENAAATWWRCRVIFEPPPDTALLFRDTDSRPCDRELAAVDEWLRQDELYAHAIRDHQWHCAVMLAGLWGIKAPGIYPVSKRIPMSVQDIWTTDQLELQASVFPVVRRHLMSHLGSSCIYEKPSQRRPLRIPRPLGGFVGQGFKADETPRFPHHVTEELLLTDEYLMSRDDVFLPQYRASHAER